jgi:plastocyanin
MTFNCYFSGRIAPAIGSVGLLITALLEVGCGSLPAMTQTGKVQEIVIGTAVATSEVTLAPGDEVRWINRQQGPVSIVFLNSIQEQVTCERGFGLAGVVNATQLAPNKGISLCFGTPGTVRYTVHLDTPTTTGQFNLLGIVHIEEGG